MAGSEPARKLDDQVYDKGNEQQPVTQPNLRAIEGGGEKSAPTGKLAPVGKDEISPEDLSATEESPNTDHERQLGRGYLGDPKETGKLTKMRPGVRGVVGFAKTNRGKVVLGGAAAGFVTLIIIGFFALLPFKILHIVNNLQSHFFATSENAVQKESDVLFSHYIKNYVLPGITACKGKTTGKNCTPSKSIAGNGLVSQLYKGWRTAKLENTLADKYGIEFKKVGNNFYIKTPDLTGNGISLGSENGPDGFIKSNKSLDAFLDGSRKVGRNELRQAYKDALAKETMWKRVMYKYKVGGLLERKYGLKRCIIKCEKRDNFADWKDNKKNSAKMIIAERVLAPRSETLALVIQCVIDNGCDPTKQSETDSDGRKLSKTQQRVQQKLAELKAKDTGKYASVLANSNEILKDGYKRFILRKIASSLGGDATKVVTDEVADKAIPVIGWINGAAGIVHSLEGAAKKIKALSYMTNATAMVSLYASYRVYADETKSGNVDPAIVGSFTNALGAGNKTSKGGTAEAEQTPLYNRLINGSSSSSGSTSALNNILGDSVYAASNSSKYLCNDGNPVPVGKLVCPEEALGADNGISDFLNGVLKGLGPIRNLADWWNGSIGRPLRYLINKGAFVGSWVLEHTPGFRVMMGYLSNAVGPIINSLTDYLIPSPFSDNMSGGRTFDLMAGGADVSGNDYAHEIGGAKLSERDATAILNEQTQQDLQDYKSESFLARMTDTNSNYSPVTKLAAAMPSNLNSVGQSVASIFSNPLGKIKGVFASLFSFNHAFAAATVQPDPFGVTQYGYASNDPTLAAANQDPEAYWDANCTSDGTTLDWSKKVNADWQNSTTPNPDTGMPENDTTNPCLLIQAGVGSAGAMFDSSLLTSEDLAGSQTTTSDSTSTPVEPLTSLNGHQLSATQTKWIKYIADNVVQLLPGSSDKQAAMAARVTWWNLKEGVLSLDNPFAYSNCGAGGDHRIAITTTCPSGSAWQVGIAGVQPPNFSLSEVETVAKARHPGMSLKDILAEVAKSAGFSDGSASYNTIVNSSGTLRKSLLLQDPATGFTFVDRNIQSECINSWRNWCGGGYFATNQQVALSVISELTTYFSASISGTAGSGIVGDIGENSDKISCAVGTKDLGVIKTIYTGSYKKSSGPLKIRLCQISQIAGAGENNKGQKIDSGAVVNSRVSGAWLALAKAAKAAGINLASNSSFRYEDSCGGTGDGNQCATRGGSPHQFGVAIDIAGMTIGNPKVSSCSERVSETSNPIWNWLYKNADKYGFKQYMRESWHWDPIPDASRCGYGQI